MATLFNFVIVAVLLVIAVASLSQVESAPNPNASWEKASKLRTLCYVIDLATVSAFVCLQCTCTHKTLVQTSVCVHVSVIVVQ